ncbi:MAG: ATPase [Proteobacteria bacterium]|nr:MAG: ATPase [Pseudomonadota bacterium]
MSAQQDAERISDRELVSSRIIHAPSARVFNHWSNPELFAKWWVPAGAPITLSVCEMDVRTGGSYRLSFRAGDQNAEFFGRYLEVMPPARLVWTNEEFGEAGMTVTTVTFQEHREGTFVTVHDLYPSKEALDEAINAGSVGAMPLQLKQLGDAVA